ncbi:MAG: flagellar basal-body rod protein FlgC [Planctomycetaceae bacterium]|nr:MAG: flagellar basal-body rod protein FlgC [Planctomycetaceae bacterium]
MFRALEVSASGLLAQRLRMDTIAGNIAQVNTTENEHGEPEPFVRRLVLMQAVPVGSAGTTETYAVTAEVALDHATPFRKVYAPQHPHADEQGYVQYPNINMITEYVNALEAARAYEANLATMQMTRQLMENTLRLLG